MLTEKSKGDTIRTKDLYQLWIYHLYFPMQTLYLDWGSGYGAVGRVVASDTRDPWFESSHRQF